MIFVIMVQSDPVGAASLPRLGDKSNMRGMPFGLRTGLELQVCKWPGVGASLNQDSKRKFRLRAKQPYGEMIDLEKPPAELLRHIEEHVAKYGDTGFVGIRGPSVPEPQKSDGGT
jgi:hypothetical protein